MPKPYDDAMKKLVGENSQDLLSWVVPGAQSGKQLPYELSVENIYADGLIQASLNGNEFLAHFEFQSSNDLRIGERLLEYNVLASRQYDYLPVYSCVIYLKNHDDVPKSPFIRMLPTGEVVVHFYYRSIELGKLSSEELVQTRTGRATAPPPVDERWSTARSSRTNDDRVVIGRENRVVVDWLCSCNQSAKE